MKHHSRSKIICLATAAMLSCWAVPADSIRQMTASAQEPPALTAAAESSSPVRVVVRLKSAALIGQFTKEALGTDETADASAVIAEQQRQVQAQIREFYPELEVGASYNVLMNGFACSLPETLFEKVQNLADVASVDILPEIAVPQMSNAAALSGMPAFMEHTGCTGEGQVICVIDSELYTDHPMFAALPDSVETKLSKDDVTEIIKSGTLHQALDPDKAYLSSKIPYAVDYVNEDRYGGVQDPDSYHGTHVSGIAAGNAIVNNDGRTVSGMAPDAQLVFMAVGSGYSINDEAALQALEDAVVLHADVINMSWGELMEYYGDNLFADVLDAADKAGITICTSAGNADNGTGSLLRSNYPESPDIATIDHKVEAGNGAFVVASADNSTTYERGVLRFEGEDILYLPVLSEHGMPYFLTDMLPVGTYEYVDYGDFTADDLDEAQSEDLSGKLMLVRHSSVEPFAVAKGASMRHAAGVLLVHDTAFEAGATAVSCKETEIPIAFISSEICERLQKAENKVIENPGSMIEQTAENKMSFYTSWGPGASLDLRPDITGIGGSVESANYNGGTTTMSGTSMSSPYVAGAAADVRQYLKEQGIELSGTELTRYVRILMMNSAIPFAENGLLVTPREQGAGLVSLERLMQTKAVLIGAENDAKVNLYDRIGDTFSFDVTLKNLSNEVVSFSDAKLCLTTDDTAVNEDSGLTVISGTRALNCTADLTGLTAVKPGDSLNVTVKVSLDPAQTSEISEVFTNGFFIDGFLMLSGAENSADISIPICGYHGDWAQIPIYSTDTLMMRSMAEGSFSFLALPLREALPIIDTILSRATQEELETRLEYSQLGSLMIKYWTKEEDHLLERGHGDAWISPNGDGMHDIIEGIFFEIKRQAKACYFIQDADGNVLFQDERKLNPPLNESGHYAFEKPLTGLPIRKFDFTALPEGDYKLSADMWINYPEAEKHPQNLEIPFKVDNTAPEMTCTVEAEGDRTYLNIHASDSGELDCVFLTALCADPSRKQTGITALHKLDMFSVYNGGSVSNEEITRTDPLPYLLAHMAPQGTPKPHVYDYSEMFPAEEDGAVDVRYDITGLTDVTVSALDRAWNVSVYQAMKGAEITLQNGIWLDEGNGYMEVSGNAMRYADFYDGSVKDCSYTILGDLMTITMPDKTIVRHLYFQDPEKIEYRQDGLDTPGKMLYYNYEWFTKLEDEPFYPIKDAYPLIRNFYEKKTGYHITDYSYKMNSPRALLVTFETEEDVPVRERMISVDLSNGIGGWQDGSYDLFSTPIKAIEPGIYHSDGSSYFFVFNEDHQTGIILVAASDTINRFYEFENRTFSYTIQNEDQIVMRFEDGKELEAYVSMSDRGLLNLFMGALGTFRLSRMYTDPSLAENFHSKSQTEGIISKYQEAVTGKPAEWIGSGITEDGEIVQVFEGEIFYFIDPFTLKGHDDKGRSIDYSDPPVLPENAKSLDTLAAWALKDYSDKTGRTDGDAVAVLAPDGTVDISIYLPPDAYDYEKESEDPFENAVYSVDPITARGTDQDQNLINLPLTGSNDPGTAAGAGLALMLFLGGAGICRAIGIRRRTGTK